MIKEKIMGLEAPCLAEINFYMEDLCCEKEDAEIVCRFVGAASDFDCILSTTPWFKHGMKRIYLEFWSQNSLGPISGLHAAYYDIEEDRIVFKCHWYSFQFIDLVEIRRLGRSYFSGAKTRNAIYEMKEFFYG